MGTALVLGLAVARADVGDPQIRTDHPLYPGELAYSTMDRFARSIIDSGDWDLGLGDSERDVALKLWLWKITHTLHDYTPKLWTPLHDYCRETFKTHAAEHPIRPDPRLPPCLSDEDQDSLRWTFSFGYALCTTQHSNIGPQIRAIGQALGKDWRSRWVEIPGDSNHEIHFGGRWRAFDVNAGTLLFSSDDPKTAELLPYKDAIGPKGGPSHPELLENAPAFGGRYLPKLVWSPLNPEGTPGLYAWMRGILQDPALYWDGDGVGEKSPVLRLMYHSAYSACPIVYGLKKGETFTRWFSGDDARREMTLPKPIWWGANLKGGPGSVCYYSHYLRGLAHLCEDVDPLVFSEQSQTDNEHALRDFKVATHSNGLYDWQPNLAAGDWREGAIHVDGRIRSDESGLAAEDRASVAFAFFSPYIIAGMPADNSDPALDGATSGALLEADVTGQVPVDVSINNGLTFKPVGVLTEGGGLDFTDAVKGRNQYLVRLHLDKDTRLKALRLRTIVTTCRAVYPKIKSRRTTITYEAGGVNAFDASPDFTSQALATSRDSFVSQENLTWVGYDTRQRVAWETDKDVASCIYRVTAPAGTLASVSAAANVTWPSPTIKDAWGEIAVSSSPDGPWTTLQRIDPQADDLVDKNVLPYYWVYGQADLSAQDVKTAYVRVRFAGAGKPCGIRYMHLYGTYRTGNDSPLTITYHWKAGGHAKEHAETIPAGQARHTYTIHTGKDIANGKVVFAVPASKQIPGSTQAAGPQSAQ
jgi:hypothetical protein